MRFSYRRERLAWSVASVLLVAFVALFAFSPRLLAATPDEETDTYLKAIRQVFEYVRDNYVDADKANPKVLYEGALRGLLEALGDPYSVYLSAEESGNINITTTGLYGGVGLVITKIDKVGAEVVSPIEGTPAYKAGICAGDIITKVNGEDISNLSNDQIANKLRGEPRTTVTVTIRRGDSIVFDLAITREVIEYPTVKSAMIPGGIGYVRISDFYPQTAERTAKAIADLKAADMSSLILDVRRNPGGTLTSAIQTADLFLSRGPIVSTRSERDPAENRTYEATASAADLSTGVPLVVLVDNGSASAAEILAGALKDRGRAILYGTTTYGKGSVQTVRSLGDGVYKVTTARFYTPGGYTIDKHEDPPGHPVGGVEPNVKIEEPPQTPEEEKAMGQLLQENTIRDFVRAHPGAGEAEVSSFINGLRGKGIALSDRVLARLVREEQNRTNNNPPVYDLDYDLVLQTAVKALRAGEVKAAVQP